MKQNVPLVQRATSAKVRAVKADRDDGGCEKAQRMKSVDRMEVN